MFVQSRGLGILLDQALHGGGDKLAEMGLDVFQHFHFAQGVAEFGVLALQRLVGAGIGNGHRTLVGEGAQEIQIGLGENGAGGFFAQGQGADEVAFETQRQGQA